MAKLNLKRVIAVAVLSSMATFAFAEDAAPVYDADNYPPQFDTDRSADPSVSADSSAVRTQPAPAATYDSSPSQSLSLDQRVARAEHQITNMQQSNSSSKMDSLQNDVQSLRGQVESLTHQLQQMQTQQRSALSDLDKRLSKQPASAPTKLAEADPEPSADPAMDSNAGSSQPKMVPDEAIVPRKPLAAKPVSKTVEAVAAKPASAKATDTQPNVAEEQQIYQTAYNLIKAKKYNEAVAALQKMLQKYPSGQFAANAHYWLGELYGLMGNNAQSGVEFGAVVKNYPDSPKVSDAQLKLGLIYSAAFKWPDAKSAFKKVVSRYPGTASARLAAEQLKQLKEAGH